MNYGFHNNETTPCFLWFIMLFNNRIKIYYGLIYYQRKCEERREENISVVSGILIDLPEIPCLCTTLKVYAYCSINDRQPKVIYQSFDGAIF